MSAQNLRDKIKATDDIREELVRVPVWELDVLVKTISGQQRDDMLSGDEDRTYRLIVASCFDPDSGEQLFGLEDIAWLKEKAARPTEFLARQVVRLNGLTIEGLREEEKNSSSTQSEDSTTT